MSATVNRGMPPAGLSPFSRAVFDAIAKYTAFPWPILTAQCKRGGLDPMNLDAAALTQLIPLIAQGVGLFTSPEKAALVRAELTRLAGSR